MSHEIDQTTGKSAIAYAGETPWHGLGQKLEPDASIETWAEAASLNWKVGKADILAKIPAGEGKFKNVEVFDRQVLYREDTHAILGIASEKRYKVVQPSEVLEFYRDLTKELDVKLEVAGALRGGKMVWALARCDKQLTIGGKDVVRPYLLLSTNYGDARATQAQFTTVRVVCNNTISMAFHEGDQELDEQRKDKKAGKRRDVSIVSIPHSKEFVPEAVKADLQLWTKAAEQFQLEAKAMASRHVTNDEAVAYVASLFGKYDKEGQLTEQSKGRMAEVVRLFAEGPGAGMKTADGTAWGLLNAVTRYVDFAARARTTDSRLYNAWFSDNNRLKNLARVKALQLAA